MPQPLILVLLGVYLSRCPRLISESWLCQNCPNAAMMYKRLSSVILKSCPASQPATITNHKLLFQVVAPLSTRPVLASGTILLLSLRNNRMHLFPHLTIPVHLILPRLPVVSTGEQSVAVASDLAEDVFILPSWRGRDRRFQTKVSSHGCFVPSLLTLVQVLLASDDKVKPRAKSRYFK